ncbi:MAG: hypothetical protein A4E65_00794 [Syntrophorhabdus sp. PtaU1.Bin153]|nr:MAG: hypothetical protein A4E65_00794 [Syntrophorhabdus sp. PtaU1.Bin153]
MITLSDITDELKTRLAPLLAQKKTGKVVLEINISQGGIGQTFIETREAVSLKK